MAIDKKGSVCYYNTMEDMKIYIDGKYSIKHNLILQAKIRGPKILKKVDDAFLRLYKI